MRVLVVHNAELSHFPPVLNLLQCLSKLGHETVLLCKDYDDVVKDLQIPNLIFVPIDSAEGCSKFTKVLRYLQRKVYIKRKVEELMTECDVIWTTTDGTVRELGDVLLKYRHIMQLMELVEFMPRYPGVSFLHFDIQKYAQKAIKVVVPEYNRAHIQKTWWNLEKTPVVLPNKPYKIPDMTIIPEELKDLINMMESEKRKILLYQGVFFKDRDLDSIAEAVDILKDKYCLYIMGRDTDYSKDLMKRHPNIVKVPFLNPPKHLYITSRAQVGLMPYVAKKTFYFSILNALYCAPNKIFEYAGCGLPMLGSHVPGIELPFSQNNIGRCYENTVESVKKELEYIDEHYEEMKKNCLNYFNSISLDDIVSEILYFNCERGE